MRRFHIVGVSAPSLVLALALSVNDAGAVTATVPGDFSLSCTAAAGCFRITNTNNGSSVVAITGDAGSNGMAGIVGRGSSFGVQGNGFTGVSGTGAIGVSGISTAATGAGVTGSHTGPQSTNPGAGVRGDSTWGFGVWGHSTVNHGVSGTSDAAYPKAGVFGTSTDGTVSAVGVYGQVPGLGTGVEGDTGTGQGVLGWATGVNGTGVYGVATGGGANSKAIFGSNTQGGYAGYFQGPVNVTGNLTVSTINGQPAPGTSDARLKKDVQNLPYGLAQVRDLRAVTFRWKEESADNGVQLGVIAQEVQRVIPELVRADASSGTLSVNYMGLIPVMLKGMQEQQKIIERQEARIAQLEGGRGASILASGLWKSLGLAAVPLGFVVALRRRKKHVAGVTSGAGTA